MTNRGEPKQWTISKSEWDGYAQREVRRGRWFPYVMLLPPLGIVLFALCLG